MVLKWSSKFPQSVSAFPDLFTNQENLFIYVVCLQINQESCANPSHVVPLKLHKSTHLWQNWFTQGIELDYLVEKVTHYYTTRSI